MTTVLYTAFCGCALIFVAGAIARAVRYARSPIHLRWELYPVPHEGPARAAYGGSYFEEGEWWRSRRRVRLAGDLRFMFVEMLFLRALREFNRPLWFRSFPFHFGLYLLVLAGGLALIAAGGAVSLQSGLPGPLLGALRWASAAAGMAGLLLAVTGALALLHRRLTDPSLRPYTTAGDVFNLVLFVVVLGAVGLGHVTKAAGSPGIVSIVTGLLSWDTTLDIPPVLGGGLVAVALLAAYIPWTHMSHFIGKYFTYHAVRWDDTPLGENRRVAEAMAAYLTRRPTWSAGHIRGNGTPTWAEVASSNPAREAK